MPWNSISTNFTKKPQSIISNLWRWRIFRWKTASMLVLNWLIVITTLGIEKKNESLYSSLLNTILHVQSFVVVWAIIFWRKANSLKQRFGTNLRSSYRSRITIGLSKIKLVVRGYLTCSLVFAITKWVTMNYLTTIIKLLCLSTE